MYMQCEILSMFQIQNDEDENVGKWVILNVEDPTVTMKCRVAKKELFLHLNLCLYVMLDSLSY